MLRRRPPEDDRTPGLNWRDLIPFGFGYSRHFPFPSMGANLFVAGLFFVGYQGYKLYNGEYYTPAEQQVNKSQAGLTLLNPEALKVLKKPLTVEELESAKILSHQKNSICELFFESYVPAPLIFRRAPNTDCNGTLPAMTTAIRKAEKQFGIGK